MRGVLTLLSQYAQLDELVLLRGPTGVGKTHLAEWVHAHSSRCHGPFVVADLLGVPETGPEVALFGVVDRFFSGVRGRAGWVELAAGGTLFIDEIDKLNLALQSKLLRLLDRREYTVVGDGRTQRADLRLIVATNTDLPQAIREGRFREDLYFRIEGLTVDVPPLRERRDEIGAWAHFMLNRLHQHESKRAGREAGEIRFSDEAVAELERREWPGNLRELESVVRRGYAVHVGDEVGADVLCSQAIAPQGQRLSTTEAAPLSRLAEGEGDLKLRLERIAQELLELMEQRRQGKVEPLCAHRGDLAMLDWIEATLLDLATTRSGRVRDALEIVGLKHKVDAGNGGRVLKWVRDVIERVKVG